jgi:hypothetical protein
MLVLLDGRIFGRIDVLPKRPEWIDANTLLTR